MGSRGQLRFDGLDITLGDGKFAGSFDLDDETMEAIKIGDNITFLVTTMVTKAGIAETKTSDLKRTNCFEVTGATVIDPKMATVFLNQLGKNAAADTKQIPGQTNFIDHTDAGTIHIGPDEDEDED